MTSNFLKNYSRKPRHMLADGFTRLTRAMTQMERSRLMPLCERGKLQLTASLRAKSGRIQNTILDR